MGGAQSQRTLHVGRGDPSGPHSRLGSPGGRVGPTLNGEMQWLLEHVATQSAAFPQCEAA